MFFFKNAGYRFCQFQYSTIHIVSFISELPEALINKIVVIHFNRKILSNDSFMEFDRSTADILTFIPHRQQQNLRMVWIQLRDFQIIKSFVTVMSVKVVVKHGRFPRLMSGFNQIFYFA